jgi:hypothetical protein
MALVDRVRERTGSDMSIGELSAMIDGITAEIVARYGPGGTVTQDFGDLDDPCTRELRTLRLHRPLDPAQPLTVVERDPGDSNAPGVAITLADTDYAVLHGGRTLQRRWSGANGRSHWAPLVTVTYTPIGDQAARDEATIRLIQLDLSYRGALKMEQAGDYRMQLAVDPAAEREAILVGLAQRAGLVMS